MKNDYPKLRAYLKTLRTPEAQEAFARACGTTLNYLRKAMSTGARMDVSLVEKIIVESQFSVPPEELRDDIDWSVFVYERAMSKMTRSRTPLPAPA
jgi:hypothetical protein